MHGHLNGLFPSAIEPCQANEGRQYTWCGRAVIMFGCQWFKGHIAGRYFHQRAQGDRLPSPPATADRSVEVHVRDALPLLCFHQLDLRCKGALLRQQHIEVCGFGRTVELIRSDSGGP